MVLYQESFIGLFFCGIVHRMGLSSLVNQRQFHSFLHCLQIFAVFVSFLIWTGTSHRASIKFWSTFMWSFAISAIFTFLVGFSPFLPDSTLYQGHLRSSIKFPLIWWLFYVDLPLWPLGWGFCLFFLTNHFRHIHRVTRKISWTPI